MHRTLRTSISTAIALGVIGSGAAFAPAAFASGGGGVRSNGACSATSTWKLKAKNDDGALEVEAEVDANKVGQHWSWKISDNGARVKSGKSATVAPSGSFTVNRTIPNLAGTDKIDFHAADNFTGETCDGSVSI